MHSVFSLQPYRFVALVFILFLAAACSSPIQPRSTVTGLRIHDIQGCSHQSSLTGKTVNDIPGVVTAKNSKGFYLQEDQPDALDCSSEAVYVFTNSYSEFFPGDRVTVTGIVEEFTPGGFEDHNLTITEIINPVVKLVSQNNPLPTAVIIGAKGRSIPDEVVDDDTLLKFDPENDGIDFLESLESMIVEIDDGVVVGPRNSYNEVVVIPTGLKIKNTLSSEGSLLQTVSDLNPERIILNLNDSNVETVNVGAHLLQPVAGIMDYSFGNFKINTFGQVAFSEVPPLTEAVPIEDSFLRIASYNTENLSRFDGESKFKKIAGMIVNELNSPDIVILHEIMDDSGVEDDGVVSASITIQKIIDKIISRNGPEYQSFQVDPQDGRDGGITGGNIRSIILYRTDSGLKLLQAGSMISNTWNSFQDESDDSCFSGSRKPTAALFELNGKNFLVVGAHLTSRGADSPVFGNLQPIQKPEEEKRICQSDAIRRFVDAFGEYDPDTRIIIAGDLNDVPWSSTIQRLKGISLKDLGLLIPANERFTYILDGNAIQLDYILSNQVVERHDRFDIVHVNSIYDHTLQISDHDAVLAFISLEN